MLVAAWLLQAVGGAILTPTSLCLVLPEFPIEQRATDTALWTATVRWPRRPARRWVALLCRHPSQMPREPN